MTSRSEQSLDKLLGFFERWMPDAFVIAILLTGLTFALVLGTTEQSPMSAIALWGDGFWNLLTFTNQIILTLLFGFVLANTPPVRRALIALAGLVRSPQQAYMLICFVSGLLALISWSWSMIGAAILALAIGEASREKNLGVHFPLLVASGFCGFVLWHQGLSGSIGLVIATPDHFLQDLIGVIPTSQTLLSGLNMGIALSVLLTLPWIMSRLHPTNPDAVKPMPRHLMTEKASPNAPSPALSPAQKLEHSRLLSLIVVAVGGCFLWIHWVDRGLGLTLNTMNMVFLLTGLLAAGSLAAYSKILAEGGRIAVPFLLQYPFYAALAALITGSGLGSLISEFFAQWASVDSLPLVTFFSAGILNLFIPSGGAQWAVQGPVMMAAAQELGADLPRTALAITLGDQWSNLIHPLTMIPILAVTGLSVRDIMGYCFIGFLWSGLIFGLVCAFLI